MIITAKDWLNRARVIGSAVDKAGPDVEQQFNDWCAVKSEIVNAAYKLPDRRERIVLIDYFCNRMTVKEIAEDLELTMKTVFAIKRSAIKNIGDVLGGINDYQRTV